MPRSIRFHRLGGPEVLQVDEVPARTPSRGEIAVRVTAIGLNRADSMFFHGEYLQEPVLPAGLGLESVGVVTAVGYDVDAALVGRRIGVIPGFSMNDYPLMAEQAIIPADSVAELPDELSDVEGAALWVAYGTAYGALIHLGRIGPGDAVIVSAASSSVGVAALQIVRAQGGVAIATTRTSAKRDRLLSLGADHVIATNEEDVAARVLEITAGRGVRFAFDPIGGTFTDQIAPAMSPNGVICLYGLLAGRELRYPLAGFGRGLSVVSFTLAEMKTPERLPGMLAYIREHLRSGDLTPVIDRVYGLADVSEAFRRLESNEQVGKIVLEIE